MHAVLKNLATQVVIGHAGGSNGHPVQILYIGRSNSEYLYKIRYSRKNEVSVTSMTNLILVQSGD
jgi:hypothetical protein